MTVYSPPKQGDVIVVASFCGECGIFLHPEEVTMSSPRCLNCDSDTTDNRIEGDFTERGEEAMRVLFSPEE